MNKSVFYFAACLLVFSRAWSQDKPQPNLMPVPAEISWRNEGDFVLSPSFKVVVKNGNEPRVEKAVARFVARLGKRTGLVFSAPSTETEKVPVLSISYKSNGLPVQSVREDESYTLVVAPEGASLSAPNPLGVMHGLQTFLQLVEKREDQAVIPSVTLHDKPRFAWRGLLIDACRHWMPVEVIKRNLDGLEEAKMNVLHWHLSEDQGFRVESLKFPKLQEMASDGNFYTQEQIKDIISYARDRGIRVVPEFDIPGHTTALVTAYPELASGQGPFNIERKYGVFDAALDPSKESVYKFLEVFIGEMAQLFPDEYFHIGGDEVNGKLWNTSHSIQRFMHKHHLKTNDDLQTYFNSRILPFITGNHKKMIGWDEVLNPKLPKTIIVQSWRGLDSLTKATLGGYDAILSKNFYLDNQLSAGFHYTADPLPANSGFTADQASHLLGGEACMWSEFVTPETIDSRVWPRALAVAERLWSPASVQDVDDMYRRLNVESARLEELGLTHNSNYLPMLERLVGKDGVESLKVLADVVTPVKFYNRPRSRAYTSDVPLTRLVDAARPESETARVFGESVDHLLQTAPSWADAESVTTHLKIWKSNNAILEPYLESSDEALEAACQSEDLSTSSQFGLEAVKYLQAGNQAPKDWQDKAKAALDRAQQSHAEVDLAVVNPIRKLVLAAGELDKLKEMKPGDWAKSLNDQVQALNPDPVH